MALTPENELLIREALAATVSGIAAAGFAIPAPLYVNDAAEFFATLDDSFNTKDAIESEPIAACWIYPVRFTDNTQTNPDHSPLIELTYGLYLFRQYGLEREDESETPEVFESMVLRQHNLFISAWLGIKAAFQGRRNMAGFDPAIFALIKTNSIVQVENILNQAPCEFVPGVAGFAVNLEETVEVKFKEC